MRASRTRLEVCTLKPCRLSTLRTKTQRSGIVDEEDARAGGPLGIGGRGLAEEGEDGFFLGGIAVQDRGEAGELEQLGDKRRRSGEADVATAAAQALGEADEQADADAVESGDFATAEDELIEGIIDGLVDCGFERLGFRTEHDAAGAVNDVDVAGKA